MLQLINLLLYLDIREEIILCKPNEKYTDELK